MLKAEIIFRPDEYESYIAVTERINPERVSLTEVNGRLKVDQVDGIDVADLPTLRQRIQVPVQQPRKFRTEPEGSMYRIYATSDGPGFFVGLRGGLIAHPSLLSQEGNCWVDETSRLEGDFKVSGDLMVAEGSVLSGHGAASGHGMISNSTIRDATLRDFCEIRDSTITRGEYAFHTAIVDSTIDLGRSRGRFIHVELRSSLVQGDGTYMYLAELCATNAWIRRTTDVVSMPTRLGSLCAYRMVQDGVVQMRVSAGCQNKNSYAALREAARRHGVTDTEMQILNGFFVMADAVRPGWGEGERVPDEVTFSFDGYIENDDD